MKLSKWPDEGVEWVLASVIGLICLAAVSALGWIIYVSLVFYTQLVILVAVTAPILYVLSFSIGHILLRKSDSDWEECNACRYRYRNLFSEYLHKRKCLPYLTKYNFK